MKLKANHPVRKALSGLPSYFQGLGAAIGEIADRLGRHEIYLEDTLLSGDAGHGQKLIRLLGPNEEVLEETGLYFSWYRMESGRQEITTYIS